MLRLTLCQYIVYILPPMSLCATPLITMLRLTLCQYIVYILPPMSLCATPLIRLRQSDNKLHSAVGYSLTILTKTLSISFKQLGDYLCPRLIKWGKSKLSTYHKMYFGIQKTNGCYSNIFKSFL